MKTISGPIFDEELVLETELPGGGVKDTSKEKGTLASMKLFLLFVIYKHFFLFCVSLESSC